MTGYLFEHKQYLIFGGNEIWVLQNGKGIETGKNKTEKLLITEPITFLGQEKLIFLCISQTLFKRDTLGQIVSLSHACRHSIYNTEEYYKILANELEHICPMTSLLNFKYQQTKHLMHLTGIKAEISLNLLIALIIFL